MPPAEEDRAVVWRLGDALLAVPLDATLEIAPVDGDGRAVSRGGRLRLRTPPGLSPPARPRRAVVVRAGGEAVAMAADDVEGVRSYTERDTVPTPAWIRTLQSGHLVALIRLDDARIAALLAVDTLVGA